MRIAFKRGLTTSAELAGAAALALAAAPDALEGGASVLRGAEAEALGPPGGWFATEPGGEELWGLAACT